MDLREVEAFVAVADELHFGRAAARLHVSQPALSQQIQRLERDVGTVLLHRTSREVALTPAGALFLERCRALLGDVADAVASTRAVADGTRGRVRVGYVGSTLYGALPAAVARLRMAHPRLELELVERKTAPQLELLGTGAQDVGIVHRPPDPPVGLLLHDVEQEPVRLAVPAGHPLADGGGPVAWPALAGVPVVLFPRALEPHTHDLIVGHARERGVRLSVAQRATGLPTILGLVRAGVGVGFVVSGVAEHADDGGLVFRELADAPVITTAVAWDPDTDNAAVATFLRTLDPRAPAPGAGADATAPGSGR